jgi:hypothetical protein
MSKISSLLITTLAGALALTGGACKSSSNTTTPPPDGGSGTIPLTPTATGFVDDPTSGVIGAWYVYADSVGSNASAALGDDHANSDCVLKGGFSYPSQCTQITLPSPLAPFMPDSTGAMCTAGTAALVLTKGGADDYPDLWGGGIGLDFNNPGGDAGVKGYYDASKYTGVSFTFAAMTLPTGYMRVNFPFMGQHAKDSPYWDGGGDGPMASSPLTGTPANPQKVTIHWADVGGPAYLKTQTPAIDPAMYPFNPSAVQAIQFQVFTNNKTVTPYAFCVSNLALLTQ